jgi:hypothetical protein
MNSFEFKICRFAITFREAHVKVARSIRGHAEAIGTGLMILVEDPSCHTFLSAGVKTRLEWKVIVTE